MNEVNKKKHLFNVLLKQNDLLECCVYKKADLN